jgi:hypothetical protein
MSWATQPHRGAGIAVLVPLTVMLLVVICT